MKEIQVLDHGFVRLVDKMGDDSLIVKAARVSTGQSVKTPAEDKKLTNYLVRNFHTSPLEMVVFLFEIRLPIFVMRQLVRHRTARLNEFSARYSEMPDEYYLPELDRIKGQGKMNKQGSEGELSIETKIKARDFIKKTSENAYTDYKYMIDNGVARELARIILPVNFYTQIFWQMDLSNLAKFLKLRMDSHAQWEIQEYARGIADLVKPEIPVAFEALKQHVLGNLGNRE